MVTLETPLPQPWTLYRYNKNDFDTLAKNAEARGEDSRRLEPYVKIGQITDVNGLIYLTQLWSVPIRTAGRDDVAVEDPDSDYRNVNLHSYVLMRGDILPIWETPDNEDGGTLDLVVDIAPGWTVFRQLLWAIVGHTLTADHPEQVNGLSVSYLNSRRTDKQSYYLKIWDRQSGRDLDSWCATLSETGREILQGVQMRYTRNHDKRHYNTRIMKDIVCLDTGCYSRGGSTSRGRSRGGKRGRQPRR